MFKRATSLILLIMLFFYTNLIVADSNDNNNNLELTPEKLINIDIAIKKVNPQFNVKNIRVSSIPDLKLYKIISKENNEVIYLSEDNKYFFYGDLLDLSKPNENDRNITELSKMFIRKTAINNFSLKKMIIFKPKNDWFKKSLGVVTIFTDLDCPYGNKLHKEVEKAIAAGLEVRYLLFPRSGIGSDSYKKAVSVWCSKHHNKAFTMANNGEVIPAISCKNNPITQQYNLALKVGVNATPTIILKNGKIIPGYVTYDSLLKLVKENDANPHS